MHTQITCPQCQTPFMAEVYQFIDARQNPGLKQALLSGQLNVATCPRCGAGGQLTTPLMFHDPEYEMFLVYVPMELNLGTVEREQLIGKLTQRAMESIPQEQRRAYLLQPQMMINMQSFLEKVLETEGVTPEMIARQKKQAELLRTLLGTTDRDVINTLLEDRANEVDETFIAMVQQSLQMATQVDSHPDILKLTNLQAKLMRETAVGQRMQKQQQAMQALNKEAQEAGLTPELLLTHILNHIDDEDTVDALANMGQMALTYEFFSQFTEKIEEAEQSPNKNGVAAMTATRDRLLDLQKQAREKSQNILEEANQLLENIMNAADREQALQYNLAHIDEAFMYVLEARLDQAMQRGLQDELQKLQAIQSMIEAEAARQMPPHLLLLNQLVEAGSQEQQEQLLTEHAHLVNGEMLEMLQALEGQVQNQPEIQDRLRQIQGLVAARL
ncbi:MAG TPA: CpXC domain-containing protein [Anaerolineae bacterium]|nr:CpXC domain-containing protein [Anaerolineae bacterium]